VASSGQRSAWRQWPPVAGLRRTSARARPAGGRRMRPGGSRGPQPGGQAGSRLGVRRVQWLTCGSGCAVAGRPERPSLRWPGQDAGGRGPPAARGGRHGPGARGRAAARPARGAATMARRPAKGAASARLAASGGRGSRFTRVWQPGRTSSSPAARRRGQPVVSVLATMVYSIGTFTAVAQHPCNISLAFSPACLQDSGGLHARLRDGRRFGL